MGCCLLGMASAGHATSKGAGDLSDGLSLLFTVELAAKINPACTETPSLGWVLCRQMEQPVSCLPLHQQTPGGLGRLQEPLVRARALQEAADIGELFVCCLPTPYTLAFEGNWKLLIDCKSSLFKSLWKEQAE